jgi:hypothetical protein
MPASAPTRFSAGAIDPCRPVTEGFDGTDYYALMAEALHKVLLEKGVLSPEDTDKAVAGLEAPNVTWGARIVAQAWRDPAYRERLLLDGSAAALELGYRIKEAKLIVVANTPALHNVIVCTLCSCYPRSLLGQPPWWYISSSYRARTVREPRKVLAEFGLELADDVELRVHDSNADMRYLVLPMPPKDSEGWSTGQLIASVNRHMLIGTAA